MLFTYSVSGYVFNSNGKPIPGVIISFSDSLPAVTTNSQGYWSQSGLSGSVVITPSLSGYTFTPSSTTVTGPNNNVNFTGIPIPPNVPSNPSPYNGQTSVPINTTLSWSGGGSNNDTITYAVYFGTTSNPQLVASGLNSTSYNPGTLSYSTTYYWYVVSTDSNTGSSSTGPLWSFTTEPQPVYTVSGYVVDSNGNGLGGVSISFSDGLSSVTTNSQGYWSQSGLSGSVVITPSLNGYTFTPSSTTVTGPNNNVNFTGYPNVSGTLNITNRWLLEETYDNNQVTGQIYSSPAISTDGTIFVGGSAGLFDVSNSSVNYIGGIVNSSNDLVQIWSSPVVDTNTDTVFVGTNNGYLISTQYPFSSVNYIPVSQHSIIGAPLCFNGNVYVVDRLGNIYEMSETSMSTSLITNITPYILASPITNGTDLLIGSTYGIFYAVNLGSGNIDWYYQTQGQSPIISTAAIGPNGNIYFAAGSDLYSLTPSGNLRANYPINLGSQITGSPVISANGIVYIGTTTGNFYAINSSSGSFLWSDNLSTSIGGIANSALLGNNGVVYVSSGWVFWALNASTGNVISEIGLGYNIESSPVLNDGYIYVGCDDGCLYQIKALSSNISSGGWPMFMSNWYHTGT